MLCLFYNFIGKHLSISHIFEENYLLISMKRIESDGHDKFVFEIVNHPVVTLSEDAVPFLKKYPMPIDKPLFLGIVHNLLPV